MLTNDAAPWMTILPAALVGLACDGYSQPDRLRVVRPTGYAIVTGDAVRDGMTLSAGSEAPADAIAVSVVDDIDRSGDLDLSIDLSQPCDLVGNVWLCSPPGPRVAVRLANGILAGLFTTQEFSVEDCSSDKCIESAPLQIGRYSDHRACDDNLKGHRIRRQRTKTTISLSDIVAKAHPEVDIDWQVEDRGKGNLRITGTTARMASAAALCVSSDSREASILPARFKRNGTAEVHAQLEPANVASCRKEGRLVLALARRWIPADLPPDVEFLFEDHLEIRPP